jgi:N-acetylglucosaminyldiphosphoundecaprenol N-acetyl-beta-D-mannosaminyltransferase
MDAKVKYVDVLGFKVFSDDLSKIAISGTKGRVINTISPNSYGLTTKDPEFKMALVNSDYLVLDGVYFAIASILLHGKNIKRNQGPDVFNYFMNKLNDQRLKAFFLGSTEENLQKIKMRAKTEFPNIEIDFLSPPFKPEFSQYEDNIIINKINSFQPDILFIGMTCPKQEKWAIKQHFFINTGLIICIGNVFDWYAGTQKEIHPIWFKLRLGWFIRIILRPEIFRRNIGNQMKFFWHVILIFLYIKKYD